MIRSLLENSIRRIPDDEIAIFLSGGVDSMSIAFAADSIGKKIKAYTFHLENKPSYDACKALEYAKLFGWKSQLIIVPSDHISLKQQWKKLASKYDCKKKTQYECTYPFLYVYPEVKETYIITGLGADSSYGLSKNAMIHHRHTKEKFDIFRKKAYEAKPGGYYQQLMLAKEYNKVYYTPYMEDEVKNYFMQFTWEQINKPFQKAIVVNAFKDYFDKVGKWRKHTSLQLDAEIDVLFETLIDDPEINFKKRSRIMDIARDWHEKQHISTLFD